MFSSASLRPRPAVPLMWDCFTAVLVCKNKGSRFRGTSGWDANGTGGLCGRLGNSNTGVGMCRAGGWTVKGEIEESGAFEQSGTSVARVKSAAEIMFYELHSGVVNS